MTKASVKPRIRMVIQPTVSHYREPLIRELLNSDLALFDLFGIRGESALGTVIDQIKDASDDVLGRVDLVDTVSFRNFRWERGIVATVVKGNYDAFVLEGRIYTLSSAIALLAGRMLRRKVYLWGHGWKREETGFKRKLRMAYYSLASGLLLYGEEARTRAIAYGLSENDLHVVGNSIYSRRALDSLSTVKKADESREQFKLIVSCRLTSRHRIDMLADAMGQLATRMSVSVTIVGDGTELEPLQQRFAARGVEATFLGAVFEPEVLAQVYRECDLAISPAASGLNVVQAMGFATPVVVPDHDPAAGPEQEAVTEGKTGFRFRYGDTSDLARAITDAASDQNRLRRMGSVAKGLVERKYVAEAHAGAITYALLSGIQEKPPLMTRAPEFKKRLPQEDE